MCSLLVSSLAGVYLREDVAIVGAGIAGQPRRNRVPRLPDAGAQGWACRMAMDMFKPKRAALLPLVEDLISGKSLHDEAAASQLVFI